MSLREIQQAFMAAVYSPDGKQPRDRDAVSYLDTQHSLTAGQQLDIYRGSVQSALVSALGDIFPRTRINLGAKFFDAMSKQYVLTHPSVSPSLDDFGEHFPTFCRDFSVLRDFPYVEDLARIEWAWHRCFHAQNADVLDPSEWQASGDTFVDLSPNILRNAYFFSSSFPIFQIWKASDPNIENHDDQEIDLNQSSEAILIWRPELQVQVAQLSGEGLTMLQLFSQGRSIAEAIEELTSCGLSHETAIACFSTLLSWQVFEN